MCYTVLTHKYVLYMDHHHHHYYYQYYVQIIMSERFDLLFEIDVIIILYYIVAVIL